jgi:hypothetical protein
MATAVADKLKIKTGFTLLTMGAPPDFKRRLQGLPPKVTISESTKDFDQLHWFVTNRAEMEKQLSKVMKLLKPGITVWVYYPKGSSNMQTDLTRDKGWDSLLAEGDKLTWISLISFDDTWSVFGFRAKSEADRKKAEKPQQEREIFKWIDPKTKEVKLPEDVSTAFKKNKQQWASFQALSFTNKKEYLEWIVTAKREETRTERIGGTMERLAKGWKNPRNM